MEIAEHQRQRLETLAKMRIERKTIEECAQELHLSGRQVRRLAQSDEYKRLYTELKESWDEAARGKAKEAADVALSTLIGICRASRSDIARVQAAKTLLEIGGAFAEENSRGDDDRAELLRLQMMLLENRPLVTVPALPALPEGVVEAEFRDVGPLLAAAESGG